MVKLSFLISTYDSGQYLDRRLHNLLIGQTEQDIEVVIVNPNSPGTDDIIAQKWAAQDKRINYIYVPEREPYGTSWLRAWKAAKGEFVTNANADDFVAEKFTEIVYKHMKVATSPFHGQKIAFGYTGIQVTDEFGRILGGGSKPDFDFEVMSRECWAGPCVTWRNDKAFKDSLDWNLMEERSRQHTSAYDYWLWLYFMSLGYHAVSIPEILTIYTQRAGSIENSDKWSNNYQTYRSIAEFFPQHFSNHLKHAKEFVDFNNPPPREEWLAVMRSGKKWRE